MKSDAKARSDAVDESAESEITIHPDGRIFAFGITAQMAAILGTIPTKDDRTRLLLARIAGVASGAENQREFTRSEEKA